jgi:ketosteroid isomerase-like protein
MTYKERATDLYEMMSQGKGMEAFEKYYADDCVICEKPTGEIRNGKEAQRKALIDWFGMIKESHGGSTGFITADEKKKVTMVQSSTDVTMKDGNRMKMEEIAVQKWNEEGQIEREEFYYQMGPPPQM